MQNKLGLILLFTFCFCLNFLNAQVDSKYYLIHTKSGSKLKGTILKKDESKIIFLNDEIGEIVIDNDDVKFLRVIKRKPPWRSQVLETKNFWLPTAIAPRRGESYYQNIVGLFNQLNYGVVNNFSIGLGSVPLFFSYRQSWPVWVMAKYSIPTKKDNLHFAVGGIGVHMFETQREPNFGVAFGLMTVGNGKNNFTVGLAYGKYDRSITSDPIVAFSGNYLVAGPFSITTENFFFINSENEFSSYSMVGGKLNWERIQLDMGIVVPRNIGQPFFAFPLVGITVPIGRGRG